MPTNKLTKREVQVLQRLVNGESNGTIAVNLGIGKKTVEKYFTNIYLKIEVESRTQAAIYALKNRIAVL